METGWQHGARIKVCGWLGAWSQARPCHLPTAWLRQAQPVSFLTYGVGPPYSWPRAALSFCSEAEHLLCAGTVRLTGFAHVTL